MKVLLLQLDGSTPNIALMRIAAHHREQGDFVYLQQLRKRERIERGLFESWDKVYASTIFTKTVPVVKQLLSVYPDAIVGGTGWNLKTLEDYGITTAKQDYSIYPSCRWSIGFSQRGCRLNCWFCVVPNKEGPVKPVATIRDIWRGEPYPKEILLLDNDFFGQDCWRERIAEMKDGGFKVCFNQGINARMLSDEAAEAIATVNYRDDSFKKPRIYTAWDSLGDEKVLFRGLSALVRHGVKPDAIMVYILLAEERVTEADLYRLAKLQEFGCRPYPMPYVRNDETRGFQRWAIRRGTFKVSWEEFKAVNCRPEKLKSRVALTLFGEN